jgi:hypothetical protein
LKNPILTLLASGSPEIVFCVLKHTDLLVFKCAGIFDSDYKQFYIKFDEPLHVKYLKIDLLAQLSNSSNMNDILEELAVYVAEVDQELSRRSIRAIGKVGFKLPPGQEHSAVDKLVELVDLEGYIQSEAVQVLVDLIRKNPHRRAGLIPLLPRLLRDVTEPPALASLIWVLGEFGDEIPEAPYLIEPVIDSFEEESSDEVKLALLTATVKLFFKRPPEVHAMMGRLFLSATESSGESQDVRDRALFYYRLLRHDVNAAKNVISDSGHHRQTTSFAEDQEVQIKSELFLEFNTLSIIYSKLQRHFIAPDKRPYDASSPSSSNTQTTGHVSETPPPPTNTEASSMMPSPDSVPTTEDVSDVSAAIYGAPVDLLGNDLLSMGLAEPTPDMTSTQPQVQPQVEGGFRLKNSCEMGEMRFQELWQEWQPFEVQRPATPLTGLHSNNLPLISADVCSEHLTSKASIFTMASGDMPDTVKLFLYGESTSNGLILCECTLTISTAQADIVVKSGPEHAHDIPNFIDLFIHHMNVW